MKKADAEELRTIWINLNLAHLHHNWTGVDHAVARLAKFYVDITKGPDE